MADNSEERKVKIVVDSLQANASLKEMAAGASLMNNQLAKMAADDPGRQKLQDDYARLKARISETNTELRTVVKSEQELREETAKLNQENREVVLNGQKVSASFKEMKDAGALLEKQLHELAADDPGRAKLLRDYQELEKRIDGVKQEMGETAEKGLTMKDALAFAGVGIGLEAAVDFVKEMGAEIAETVKEVGELRSSINGLTGATGTDLDALTTGIMGVAKTFGKEYNEVLVASNALSKQMGISQQEAIRLIEQGFLSGADASGEFLDQVKEYAPQFKAAGLSANEAIGMISQSVTTGVFSDKGADVIKEFNVRISEQTKATSDAMQAAFGDEFTQKIFDGLNNGSMTSAQALQRVAQQMNDTKIPANQLQTVIADVFGGPGEDAGLAYIKSLKNVAKGVDEMVDKTNVYTQRQAALLASNKELAESQNALTKEFEGSNTIMQTLGNKAMTVLYTMLASLATTFRELAAPVQEVWASLMELGESMGWVSKEGTSAKTVGEALGGAIRALLTPTRLAYGFIAELVKGFVDWAKSSEVARAALVFLTQPIRDLYALLSNGPAYFAGFSAEAESRFGTIGRAWRKILDRDFSGAAAEFSNMGKNAGDAFTNAFNAATAKKAKIEAEATVKSGGQEAPLLEAGGDGTTKADRDKAAAAAEKERAKERKQRAAEAKKALEEQAKIELEIQRTVEDAQVSMLKDKHAREIAEINLQTNRKMAELKGNDEQILVQWEALEAERQRRMAEVRAKQAEEEEKLRLEKIDKELAQNEADQEVALAELQLKLATGAINQQAYDDAVLAVKAATAEKELALLRQRNGEESTEYKKAHAEKMAADAALAAKKRKADEDDVKFKKTLSAVQKILGSDEVDFLTAMLGKKNALVKAQEATQKAQAIREIYMSTKKQIAAHFETGSKIKAMAPPVSIPVGVAYELGASAISFASGAKAVAEIAGFRVGGRTSRGAGGAGKGLVDLNQLTVGTNGKLLDQQGFAVAGIVHENEYVIPEWMRADPKVAQVEQWLETRRLQGYATGGATTAGGSQAPLPAEELAGSGEVVDLLRQMVEGQHRQDKRIDTWARELRVVQDTIGLSKELDVVKEVQQNNGIIG